MAAVVNAAILYAVNVWPGWQAVLFLTDDMSVVIGVVNASIVLHLVANLLYVLLIRAGSGRWGRAHDRRRNGRAASIWQVFPFDFSGSSIDWALVVRIAVAVAIVGSAIAIVAGLVSFVKSIRRATS